MTHVLEHFPMAKTQEVLLLIRKLLKKGGKLYIEVPNFYWHALEIVANPLDRQIVEYAFGGQLNKWDYHYNSFTPELLHEDLGIAGYIVDSLVPNSSIECWASKP
jgi:Cft2 family RNA processing exonuclease